MHSNRMRTARVLTVSQHALCGEDVCPGGFSARCVSARVWVSAQEVVCPEGDGVSVQSGDGVSVQR